MDNDAITKLKDRVNDITDMIGQLQAKRERDSKVLHIVSSDKKETEELTLEELYAYVDMLDDTKRSSKFTFRGKFDPKIWSDLLENADAETTTFKFGTEGYSDE